MRDTKSCILLLGRSMKNICKEIVLEAKHLGLEYEEIFDFGENTGDTLIEGHFSHDLESTVEVDVKKYSVKLSTEFLNLASQYLALKLGAVEKKPAVSLENEKVSEEGLRMIEIRAHNLQTLYDTYIQSTPTENLDKELIKLRGYIAVIFHLLEIGTSIAHINIRTLSYKPFIKDIPGYNFKEIYHSLMLQYSFVYTEFFFKNGLVIARKILHRYINVVTIEIPIPHYRGFHVRPSTLLSQIVRHYGSEVSMEIEGETYDAGSPLELFRANEAINRVKRQRVSKKVVDFIDNMKNKTGDLYTDFRHIVLSLAEKGAVIIYEALDLDKENLNAKSHITLEDYVMEGIARLMSMAKIDICVSLKARITGDERTLSDMAVFAQQGYGEDRYGHNIPLPSALPYLHRSGLNSISDVSAEPDFFNK
jgi:hypothetical protein